MEIDKKAIATLKGVFQGEVMLPSDSGYDEARSIWNRMIDRHPALIAQCRSSADIAAAVNFARENDLILSVRGSGHNVAGNAVCDDGLMIDLSGMKGVELDLEARTVSAASGVVFGELDKITQPHGFAVPGGIISETGISGLTLGGGFGWISRKYGLTCDNLASAEVVLANGDLVTASDSENSDLFWGIRGGGGNFGVVASFTFNLRPIEPEILAGVIMHRIEDARDVLRAYRDFMDKAPNGVGGNAAFRTAPAVDFVPDELHGKAVISLVVSYAGDPKEGEKVLKPLRDFGKPVFDMVALKPLSAHNSFADAGQPNGMHYYWKSEYVTELPDEALDEIAKYGSQMTSVYSRVGVFRLGGAIKDRNDMDMAYSHREAEYVLAVNTGWADPKDSEREMQWTRDYWEALRPFSMGGSYVNFLSEDDGEDRVRAAYGVEKYERLAELKKKYDPNNLFRMNQNIKPA
jgi:FAD/FMN-containing dehydrogenase